MKNIILGLCLVSGTTLMCAAAVPTATVPIKVKAEFRHEYKTATDPSWAMKDGKWDVHFLKDGNMPMIACYNWTGHRIDTRVHVAQKAVPAKVLGELDHKHPAYTHDFTKVERPWKRDLYMVKVKENGSYKPVYLDKNGHEHDYASR